MAEYKIEKKKLIFNADFKPSVDFFPKQYDLIKKYHLDFPNWELSGTSFIVQDKTNHCSAMVTHKRIVFELDDADNKIDFAKERISKTLRLYSELLPIESFLRLGDPTPKNWTVYKLSLRVYNRNEGGLKHGKAQIYRRADYRDFEEARTGRKGIGSLQGN